jgi:uncharacterized protein YbjT (DUF2867 family)
MENVILVIGATGMMAQPVAHCLKESGFGVRILTRDIHKARKLFSSDFEILVGDPKDPTSLEDALRGCSGVHISLSPDAEQQVAENVAKLAPRAGIERITYISGATVAEENRWFPMVNGKFLAEKALRESGIPYTILCPTWVMNGLPMFVNQGKAAILGKQPCPYHWVAAEDIARMVVTAYGLGDAATNRFIVHGPEAILMKDALSRYCEVFEPGIKGVSSMPFWLVRLIVTLTKDSGLRTAGDLLAYFEKVGEGSHLPDPNCVLGTPQTTLEMWLAQKLKSTPQSAMKSTSQPAYAQST